MSSFSNFLRRNFEPLILSAQVFVDLGVLLFSCVVGYWIGTKWGSSDIEMPDIRVYRQVWALMSAVCLVSFHAFGMYSPVKSLLNMEEFKAIAKATVVSFFVFWTLTILLLPAQGGTEGAIHSWLNPFHEQISLPFDDLDGRAFSRLTVVFSFGLILVLTTASRFASFKYIQALHRRGIGNRNVLIVGAGACGQKLQSKFMLVPTLGLNLVGFLADESEESLIHQRSILGTFEDLEPVVKARGISEVFVALPDQAEDRVMEIAAECERIGAKFLVVPRFYHLLSHKIRIENLDSIPLITRAERRRSLFGAAAKRFLDILLSSTVLLLGFPLFMIAATLIKRESEGPVFFIQDRIGRDGKPFKMYKFRTMHQHMSGDAPTPNSPYDPRITKIGRYLRRYSLDELPQLLNVLRGDMSIVGPRPEMSFIVEEYGPLERDRLRVKPGITGLWQISYDRQRAIHDNLDYDLYYIEHQSLLLDMVIIALTGFAVVKGTGAY